MHASTHTHTCRVPTNKTKSGAAVVKMWCVPVRKALQAGLGKCHPAPVYAQVKLLLAQQKVCGCALSCWPCRAPHTLETST